MRLLGFLLLMCVADFLQAQVATGDAWAKVEREGKGTIAFVYVETPALVYKNSAGNLTGICVDVMKDFVAYVSKAHNVKIDVSWMGDGSDFKVMYDAIKAADSGVFALGNITITENRKKEVRFSPAFIPNFAILITQSQIPMLTGFEDLKRDFQALTAYTTKGTLDEKRIAELKQKFYPNLQIVYTSNSQETLEKVTGDPNGIGFLDMAFYLKAVRDRKAVKRHPIGDRGAEQFGFAMPLKSDWSPLFEEFFAADGGYTNSPQYKAILTRHLGEMGVKLLQSGSTTGTTK